ncbi:NAD-binding protein [Fomitiporia mediterranea MF3/22]|uniref:NAD-binding protein n=1 Tax=Fomitiporia mediterranea (strain MF3/22) TaxID=694068 RepID=UPI0004408656|nr:NAD-binding protein [Fomitiporia mediterranea MF3/22]EJD08538.1 NAD-binding protein [Fomitiporia mediterranea MF3/22]
MLASTSSRLVRQANLYRLSSLRFLSSTSRVCNRAIIFSANGPPTEVLRVASFPDLPPPQPNSLNIRFLLSPINPSDINVVEGVYPAKPEARTNLSEQEPGSTKEPCFVVGNEGVAEVSQVGDGVQNLKVGDRVVMVKPQAGTWSTGATVREQDVVKVPSVDGKDVSDVQAATMSVNPPTAYNMLKNFVDLREGDWVVQNGANSAVGQAVIQIAACRGLKTLNFIRDRPDFSALAKQLQDLGATHVLPLETLADKATRSKTKQLTDNANIRLALNCVSGPTTAALVGLLGQDAHLVSYGAMSKQPLSLPTSAFIFKGLTAHGFMQNRWYRENGIEKREELMRELASMMVAGKLQEPVHTILDIPRSISDEEALARVRDVIAKVTDGSGKFGKKVLLKFES